MDPFQRQTTTEITGQAVNGDHRSLLRLYVCGAIHIAPVNTSLNKTVAESGVHRVALALNTHLDSVYSSLATHGRVYEFTFREKSQGHKTSTSHPCIWIFLGLVRSVEPRCRLFCVCKSCCMRCTNNRDIAVCVRGFGAPEFTLCRQ